MSLICVLRARGHNLDVESSSFVFLPFQIQCVTYYRYDLIEDGSSKGKDQT